MITTERDTAVQTAPASHSKLQRFLQTCNGPIVAYILLFALQLKVLWRIWDFHGLTEGDTSAYYSAACVACDRLRFDLIWSPLYALFGSVFVHVTRDPLFYCIGTRVVASVLLSLLILSVARKLLPPGWAWLIAAWWTLTPTAFNCPYQIALFNAVPVVLSWLILLHNQNSRWHRGAALAIMFASSTLLANEQIVYTILLALCISIAEIHSRRKTDRSVQPAKLWKPYLVPLLFAVYLILLFYARGLERGPELLQHFREKQVLTTDQQFAVTYRQKRPRQWDKNPWAEYRDLMTEVFHQPEVTLPECVARNPGAMFKYFSWNAAVIPYSLQALLFDEAAKPVPGFAQDNTAGRSLLLLSLLAGLTVLGGSAMAIRRREQTAIWLSQRRWALVGIACYTLNALCLLTWQSPNPSLVLPSGVALMLLVGFGAWQITSAVNVRHCTYLPPALLILVLVPQFYPHHVQEQRLLRLVRFLQPHKARLALAQGNVLVPYAPTGSAQYLYGGSFGKLKTRWIWQKELPLENDTPLLTPEMLKQNHAQFVISDSTMPTTVSRPLPLDWEKLKLLSASSDEPSTMRLYEVAP